MRIKVVAPLALMAMLPALALAAGRPATETCVNAGYRPGTPSFEACVGRVAGDDPLSALEDGVLERADGSTVTEKPAEGDPLAAVVPARPPLPGVTVPAQPVREELPASYNAPTIIGMPGGFPSRPPVGVPNVPSPNPAPVGNGSWWPTPPTMPNMPTPVAPTLPWNFGGQ